VGRTYLETNLHKMLLNPFYLGQFKWQAHVPGHASDIHQSRFIYACAQDVLHGFNRPKYSKRDIAFRGLLTCAHYNCTVTAEVKKEMYVYYRCSGGRGPCEVLVPASSCSGLPTIMPRHELEVLMQEFGPLFSYLSLAKCSSGRSHCAAFINVRHCGAGC
jgi:hypothetical protein